MAEQGELFRRSLPARIQAADDFSRRARSFPLRQALRRRYIRPSPPGLRIVLPFDLDHDDPLRWDSANLPEPHVTVMNLDNGRSHMVYVLECPVRVGCDNRPAMRYLGAIEACYTARLGADPAYSGCFMKNPWSPAWRVLWGSAPAYTLHDLAEWVPEIARHRRPERSTLSSFGRNCETFDAVRFWAYRYVLARKADGVTLTAWRAELEGQALHFTSLNHRPALPYSECRHIGKSVSTWTWKSFSLATFRAIQAHRGRRSGRARRRDSITQRRPWEAAGCSRATWYRRRRETRTISGKFGLRGAVRWTFTLPVPRVTVRRRRAA